MKKNNISTHICCKSIITNSFNTFTFTLYSRLHLRLHLDIYLLYEVETNYASFDFHFWVLFFRFSPFSTYCTFVNTVLTHIKIGTSVEWNCSNNLSKYWNTSTSFKHFTSTSNIWKSSHNLKRRFFESTLPILCFVV